MKNQLEKNAGISLIIGSVLGIITMVLHPVGGDIDHLINISTVIIASHTLALFSIPFLMFGFWGLSRKIGFDNSLSVLALITVSLSLVAVMIAAALNGLVVSFFVDNLKDANPEQITTAEMILSFGFSINQAFDYIFIGGTCEAFLLWSIAMIKGKVFPKWIAFLGIVLGLGFLVIMISGFVLVDIQGFRLFFFGIVAWMVAIGIGLFRTK
ncbi:MAG: hypothetical protein ACJAVN_000289 [Roseivirga sp.]|jgi:hypothetical protein